MRFGSPPFCSKEHRAAYHERQEQLALTSLMRTRPARPASETALPNLDELAAAALSAPAAPAAPPAPVAVAQAEPDPPSPAEYLAYGPDFAPPASGVLAPDLDPAEAPVRDLLQLARHTGASGGERDLGFASLVDLEELGAPCGGGSRARAPEGLGERLGAPGPAAAGPSLTPAFETDLAMARLARLSAGEAQGDPVGAPWTGIENHHAPLADGPGRCAMPAAPCGLGERWIPEGACAPLGEPAATPLPVPAPQIGAPWEAVVPESPRKPAGSALFWCASGFPSLASAVAPQGVLAKATPAQPYARPSLAAALGAGALATAKPSQLDGSENWVWAGLAGLTLEPNRAAASPVRVGLSRAAVEPGLSKPGRAEGLRAGLAGASLLNVEFSPGAGFAPAAGVVAGSEDRLNASCATAALTAAASGLRPLETAVEPADEWASLAAPEAEEGTAGLRRVLVALAEEPLRGPSIAGRALAGGERLPAQAAAVSFEAPHGAVEDHPYRMRRAGRPWEAIAGAPARAHAPRFRAGRRSRGERTPGLSETLWVLAVDEATGGAAVLRRPTGGEAPAAADFGITSPGPLRAAVSAALHEEGLALLPACSTARVEAPVRQVSTSAAAVQEQRPATGAARANLVPAARRRPGMALQSAPPEWRRAAMPEAKAEGEVAAWVVSPELAFAIETFDVVREEKPVTAIRVEPSEAEFVAAAPVTTEAPAVVPLEDLAPLLAGLTLLGPGDDVPRPVGSPMSGESGLFYPRALIRPLHPRIRHSDSDEEGSGRAGESRRPPVISIAQMRAGRSGRPAGAVQRAREA